MLPKSHLAALRVICRLLEGVPAWAVTGSTALAAQGVPVQPHDIDLQTDTAGAYAIQEALTEFMVRPVAYSSTGQIRSHFGAAVVARTPVEIMGDVEVRRPDGSWRPSPDLTSRLWVEAAGLRLPVLPLEHEYEAYRLLGRTDRAELLRPHLAGGASPLRRPSGES